MSEWDHEGLKRRQLRAIGYLAKLPNYRIKRHKKKIVLEHFCPIHDFDGSWWGWREVATHKWGLS